MLYKLRYFTIFEVGQRKDADGNPHQEDCIYPDHTSCDDEQRLFIVCDGMGGHDAGEVASSTVCNALSEAVISTTTSDGPFSKDDFQRALAAAYDALDRKDTGADKKMGTTLAFLKLCSNGYLIAHIGDSRVYHVRPGRDAASTSIVFRTEDHSLVNHLVKKGEMTPAEALVSDKRNIITRAMQPNMERRCRADVHMSHDVCKGDYFMLCSDGMLERMSDYNIRAIFSDESGNDKNKIGILSRATSANNDNHSAIIVHILDVFDDNIPEINTDDIPVINTVTNAPVPNDTISNSRDSDHDKPKVKNKRKVEINVDEPMSLKDKISQTAARAKKSVGKHTDKDAALPYNLKIILVLIALLTLVMIIYYAFIHSNENLQTAGTALDRGVPQTEDVQIEKETYGYEITDQDILNEAEEIAPEVEDTPDEVIDEVIDQNTEPITDDTPELTDDQLLQE